MTPSPLALALRLGLPTHACPRCQQGRVALDVVLLRTWQALHDTEPRTVVEVAERTKQSSPAERVRLQQLVALGLARPARPRKVAHARVPVATFVRVAQPEERAQGEGARP